MREMKYSGVSWIGIIPSSWRLSQTRRLFRNDKEIVGDMVDNYERLALTLNGVIKRSKEDSEGLQPEKFEGYQILRPNELVFKMIDLENVNTSRVGLSPYTGLVSPAYIILKNDNDDNRFAYYWFISMYYNEVFNHLGGNGVRSALNAKDLLSLPIPNISVNEQKSISDYLDSKCSQIDAAISKQENMITSLKEYRASLINEIVAVNSGVKCRLGLIADMKNGLNYSSVEEGTPIKFLSVGDFKDYFIINNKDMFSDLVISNDVSDEYLLQSGDIIFVRSNGSKELVGRAVMVCNIDFRVTYSGFCIRFRNQRKDVINNDYLLYYLRSSLFRGYLEKYSQGSNINNLSQDLLSGMPIVIPSMEYQKDSVLRLKRIDEIIDKKICQLQESVNKLKEYKRSLIFEVVTGKKEV